MVPLYVAHIEELGLDDFVHVVCMACGHDEIVPKIGLIAGLRVPLDTAFSILSRGCAAESATRRGRRS